MKTDRELLELAARAAAMELWEGPEGAWRDVEYVRGLLLSCGCELWNPLADDGDALRLAVKLGLSFDSDLKLRLTVVENMEPGGIVVCEHHNDDPDAATRRAIVRAAAAIGEQMP
ncbi:hypothetical protein [Roseateles sp.]|uniref:hypothetical protein n=1 Tax=Roseateles sp. TaxID=1971397 RepID=UPI002E0A6BAC|nr:hypothetical protein [Roseateles sp.]